jgi:hypothetical protein
MDGVKTAFSSGSAPIMDDGSGRPLHKVGVLRFEFRWPDGSLTHKDAPKSVIQKVQKQAKNNENKRISKK